MRYLGQVSISRITSLVVILSSPFVDIFSAGVNEYRARVGCKAYRTVSEFEADWLPTMRSAEQLRLVGPCTREKRYILPVYPRLRRGERNKKRRTDGSVILDSLRLFSFPSCLLTKQFTARSFFHNDDQQTRSSSSLSSAHDTLTNSPSPAILPKK